MSSKIPISRKSTAQPSVSALKRTNSQTSIPVLRRSNSQSSIQQRQSRSSVRGPSQVRLRTRSLAVKSPLICSNLQVPNYGSGLIRARSTSNVRYATPQQERREISPYSLSRRLQSASSCSSATKDLRPVNDKDWQRLQLARVKSFLCDLDPSLPNIKPLSISVFITTMNLLLKEFDSRITITPDNYKDEVIKYLKTFSYPGIIKPSLIKNISAPHEFPKVLAIVSWLIDRIELIRKPEKIIRPARVLPENVDLYHMLLSYSIQKFKLWNRKEEAGADDQLRDELYAYYNIESLNIEDKRKELEMLKAKAASLQEIKLNLDSKEKETEQLQKDSERAKISKQEYIKQKEIFAQDSNVEKEEKLRRIERVKQLIQEEEDRRKSLQIVLDVQMYDHVEKDNLNKKVQELNHTIKLNQDRINAQTKSISNYDDIILTTKLKLEEKIHKYNNDISKLSLLNRNLNELKIPETDFMESTFLDVLNKTIEKKNKCMEKLQAEFKEKQKEYGKISSENKEAQLDIDDTTKDLTKKNLKVENLKEQLDKLNYTKKNEINRKQVHLDELNKNLADQKTEAENKIEGCKKRIQDSEAELAKHKDSVKRHCELSKDFFKNIANSICQTIAERSEQRESITNVLIEASSSNVISESTAACLGVDLPSEVKPIEEENKNL